MKNTMVNDGNEYSVIPRGDPKWFLPDLGGRPLTAYPAQQPESFKETVARVETMVLFGVTPTQIQKQCNIGRRAIRIISRRLRNERKNRLLSRNIIERLCRGETEAAIAKALNTTRYRVRIEARDVR